MHLVGLRRKNLLEKYILTQFQSLKKMEIGVMRSLRQNRRSCVSSKVQYIKTANAQPPDNKNTIYNCLRSRPNRTSNHDDIEIQ